MPILKPQLMFVLYQDNSNSYFETRTIDNEGNPSNGKPTTYNDIQIFKNYFIDTDQKPDGFVPKRLLYVDNKVVCFYNRPNTWTLLSKSDYLKEGEYKLPYIVYYYNYKRNYLQVYYSYEKPNPNTKLYLTYLPNQYQDGGYCMGNVKIKEEKNIFEYVETIPLYFFSSYFTEYHLKDIDFCHRAYLDNTKMIDVREKEHLLTLKELCS